MRKLRHRIEHAGVRFALALAGALPLSVARAMGALLGRFAFDGLRIRRGVVVENITRGLGLSPSEAVRIGRDSYANLGRSLMEFSAFRRLRPDEVLAMVAVEHPEYFDEALAGGKGALIYSGHFGSWELFGAVLAARGYPIDFLVGEQSNLLVDGVMNDLRRAQGIGIIARGVALRGVLRALKDNHIVAILSDQNVRQQGVFIDFLGRPASTAKGPALFAIKQGCPILPIFVHREGNALSAKIDPALWPNPELDGEEAVLDLTQRCSDSLAKYVRAAPQEYFWAHRRWKTQPPATQ